MVLKKCSTCNKNITKKCPGIECSRCEKCVHATTDCAKISNKQLSALRSTNGLEWSCENCLSNMSKRSSFFIPEEDSDTDEVKSVNIDVKKLLHDITIEMRKTIKEELETFQDSLEFIGEQVSRIEETIKNQNTKIKHLEHKNMELLNHNKNLDIRLSAMEQRLQEMDQKLLSNVLEIAGIPKTQDENVKDLVQSVASKLNADTKDVHEIRRITGRTEKSSYIMVEMNTKVSRDKWLQEAKTRTIQVKDITTNTPPESASARVYVREALTHSMKALLYNAKQKLRGSFQFVWCKAGKIFAKKDENAKPIIIYCLQDLDNLVK